MALRRGAMCVIVPISYSLTFGCNDKEKNILLHNLKKYCILFKKCSLDLIVMRRALEVK